MFGVLGFIIFIIVFVLVYDKLARSCYANEAIANYQESIDKKLTVLVEQLADPLTRDAALESYQDPNDRKKRRK